ncbi:Superoxide-generating NADPH oxidase heavy chain subunit B-like protein [Cladobotryum mycophilum]|uniref:Superoxide-generating NADPH oxidase heavy chain subunit B-like protein n=1 Tax=Cladobotryum mycophilum TaxID=491253 RepID=A0ABR0SVK0_9HYPO
MVSASMFKPIIDDQYTAAKAYFLCVIGMLFFESMLHLPSYLLLRYRKGRPALRSKKHSKLRTAIHKLVALPSAIPFITHNNLPILLRVSVFTLLNFLWGWNKFLYTTNYQLYGWLTIANGGLGLLFGSRSNLFATLARIPSSVLLMYHRWIGLATFVHATLHVSLIIQHYVKTNQFAIASQAPRIPAGLAAWICLAIIALLSIPSIVRRRWFEAFYYPHFLFIVFVAGALYHAKKGPEFLLPGFGLWVIDRAIRFYNNFRAVEVKSVTHYSDVTKFQIGGVRPSHPGQIAWVQIPSISFFNWHPFTIASAPGQDTATIAVRALGSYTRKLQMTDGNTMEMAPMTAGSDTGLVDMARPPKVRIDGPYGVGRIQWGQHPVVVLVAGGIGITPSISIATHIVNQAAAGVIPPNGPGWHVHLLWTVKDLSNLAWFEEELKNLATMASDPAVSATLDVTIHVTKDNVSRMETASVTEQTVEKMYRYEGPGQVFQGRPDMMKWFEDVRDTRRGMDASVNLCGPTPMVDSARTAASKASCEDILFHVEEEVFNF